MQVYFIDNEDYIQNRELLSNKEGEEYEDNDERSIFFIRGVMETIKKLRWVPDVIHCHGWFAALAPLYIKKGYADDPCFKNSKVICSLYDESFSKPFQQNFADKLRFEGIGDVEVNNIKELGTIDYTTLMKLAIDYSDGIILGSGNVEPELLRYATEKKVEQLPFRADFDQFAEEINQFYDKIDA